MYVDSAANLDRFTSNYIDCEISCLQEISCVATQDISCVATQEIGCVATQEIFCVATQEISCGPTRDLWCGHTRDLLCGHARPFLYSPSDSRHCLRSLPLPSSPFTPYGASSVSTVVGVMPGIASGRWLRPPDPPVPVGLRPPYLKKKKIVFVSGKHTKTTGQLYTRTQRC